MNIPVHEARRFNMSKTEDVRGHYHHARYLIEAREFGATRVAAYVDHKRMLKLAIDGKEVLFVQVRINESLAVFKSDAGDEVLIINR